ncbi:MAG: type II secretion system inner membrane protein GspF [Deltaproteobacteria bacterium]|nr:type II secretion system inner membrane protein GspF [Deltaproteobacteria bacterium]
MPVYEFRGFDAAGRAVKGLREADSPKGLRSVLRKDGMMVTDVFESGKKGLAKGDTKKAGGLQREVDLSGVVGTSVSMEEVAIATRQLATLLGAGIPLVDSLTALVEQVENKGFKRILSEVKSNVNEGQSLATALEKHPKVFTNLFVNMIRAGESSGALDVVLLRLADFTEGQSRLRNKILSALMYPAIMILVGVGIMVILFTVVIPRITLVFKNANAQLPLQTRMLIFASETARDWWFILLPVVVVGVLVFRRWLARPAGRAWWDRAVLKLPVFGHLVRMLAVARFTRTLGTLLSSGVQLLAALDIVKNIVNNTVIARALEGARESIREGEAVAIPLRRSGEFPPIVIHMITIGEKSGQLEAMLFKVAESYETQVEVRVGMLTTLLEPLMILIMGGVVGFIVFSILMPILQLNQFVK